MFMCLRSISFNDIQKSIPTPPTIFDALFNFFDAH